jgi:hypothetical protein
MSKYLNKKTHLTTEDWDAIRAKHAAMTPAEARAWIREVMGPPKETLEGKEREHVLLLLALTEPFKATNNQHSWTEYYMIGETEYHVTTFSKDAIIVDKMLKEEE